MAINIPGAEERTVIIGPTGSGKTVGGAWLLSLQNFEKRPWVALDFKDEILWDKVGDPPMRPLRIGQMPGKSGLYRMHVNPWDSDELEDWMMKIWSRGNVGIFADEASLIDSPRAFKAILRQGRSKRIPVIACTQRPVDCDREIFTEAQVRILYGVEDMARDYPVIKGLFGSSDVKTEVGKLQRHHSLWYDARDKKLQLLKPVPSPDTIAKSLREKVPYSTWLGG